MTQQQLLRVVTAQGMQLQGIAPTFFAVPNGFSQTSQSVLRHTASPSSGKMNKHLNYTSRYKIIIKKK